MLFNSYTFLFAFLPATFVAYLLAARVSPRLGSGVLVIASLFFYGWWNPIYVPLLLGSAAFNYTMSRSVEISPQLSRSSETKHLHRLRKSFK